MKQKKPQRGRLSGENSAELIFGDMRLFLMDAPLVYSTEPWEVKPHFHLFYEVHIIEGEPLTVWADGKTLTVRNGDILLIPPRCSHAVDPHDSRQGRLCFPFSVEPYPTEDRRGTGTYAHYADILRKIDRTLLLPGSRMTSLCVLRLAALSEEKESLLLSQTLNTMLFLEIMSIAENFLAKDTASPRANVNAQGHAAGQEAQRRRELIENYIERNYSKKISYTTLAEVLYVGRGQCVKLVRQLTGTTLHDLVLKQRMTVASRLIRMTRQPLEQVAVQVGYTSYSGFFVAYRRYFGVPPEEDRKGTQPNV